MNILFLNNWNLVYLVIYQNYFGGIRKTNINEHPYRFVQISLSFYTLYKVYHFSSGITLLYHLAQSAGTVQYTDCTSVEEQVPLPMSVLIIKLNNLVVFPFIAIAPRSTLALSGSTW